MSISRCRLCCLPDCLVLWLPVENNYFWRWQFWWFLYYYRTIRSRCSYLQNDLQYYFSTCFLFIDTVQVQISYKKNLFVDSSILYCLQVKICSDSELKVKRGVAQEEILSLKEHWMTGILCWTKHTVCFVQEVERQVDNFFQFFNFNFQLLLHYLFLRRPTSS